MPFSWVSKRFLLVCLFGWAMSQWGGMIGSHPTLHRAGASALRVERFFTPRASAQSDEVRDAAATVNWLDLGVALPGELQLKSLIRIPGGIMGGNYGSGAPVLFQYLTAESRLMPRLPLSVAGAYVEQLALGANDRVYATTSQTGGQGNLVAIQLPARTVTDLGKFEDEYGHGLTVGKNGKVYIATCCQGRFSIYDLGQQKWTHKGRIITDQIRLTALTTAPDGQIYGTTSRIWIPPFGNAQLYKFDVTTERATVIGTLWPGTHEAWSLVTNPIDGRIYGTVDYGMVPRLFVYDPANPGLGIQDLGATVAGEDTMVTMAVAANGKVYAATGPNGYLVVYDPANPGVGIVNFGTRSAYGAMVFGDNGYLYAGNSSHLMRLKVNGTPDVADLRISKSANPDPVGAGQWLQYTLVVTNTGPDAATNVQVQDRLPASLTFNGAPNITVEGGSTGNVTVTGEQLTGDVATLNPGGVIKIVAQTIVNVNATGATIVNTASVTTTLEMVPANNTASVTINLITPTPTHTSSPTPIGTATATATATATPTTPAPTPTATPSPPANDEAYEPNDSCSQARAITTNGTMQVHRFEQRADADWVHFNTTAGTSYLVEVQIPPDSSADVALELYPDCTGVPSQNQDPIFSPGVRLEFAAVNSSSVYLRLTNHDPTLFGTHATYQLSVRALNAAPAPGALILVAGRLRVNDALQPNIDQVANRVYQLFQNQGYGDDRIFYLHSDLGRPGVDATASVDNLRNAITTWAADKVDANHALTLYLVDHGAEERFYLDKPAGQWLAPDDLDAWLSTLESAALGLKVNIIVEACHSGSFIGAPLTISKAGRVVITSTNIQNDAYASDVGAVFSDHFLMALGQGSSLSTSFATGRWAAAGVRSWQEAWLDGDGDGLPNEAEDEAVAAQRGFAYAGSLADDAWPPYIAKAHGPVGIANRRGVIQATVYDDIRTRRVWAVIYPPSYAPPVSGEALVQEALPTLVLQNQGNNEYAAEYTGFDEAGTYRIVIYAEDDDSQEARPVAVAVRVTGGQLYLPLVTR